MNSVMDLEKLQDLLGYRFGDLRLLRQSLTHVSYGHEFKPAEFCDRTQKVTSNYSDHWPIHVEFDLSILF